jgi:transposase InsO family protein
MTLSEDFRQIRLKFTDPIQHDYEVVRPIVLFSKTVSERSRETDVERTKVGDQAKRFVQEGMFGLGDHRPNSGRKPQDYPPTVAAHILYLKRIYPPIHYREIMRIIERKYGCKTNQHALKKFLESNPVQLELEFSPQQFHEFQDAYQARWTVIQMHSQGWNKKSIAGCLKLSRRHVGRIIKAFNKDGFTGLEDHRSRPQNHPDNQMTLPFLKDVLDLQKEYPRAGEFRVHGILQKQSEQEVPSVRTVGRAMAVNREFHDAPPPWQSDKKALGEAGIAKFLRYRPHYRHDLWCIDIRYLVKIEDQWVYSICVLEGYSRTILAGMASKRQNLTAILQILFVALSQYGCPDSLVSDNAGVFTSPHTKNILQKLQIDPLYIQKGQPWENLIEPQFKVQLRIADFKFENSQTFEEIQSYHAQFVETFNTTNHWAHTKREDGRHTPEHVLDWVRGRIVEQETLQRLFQSIYFSRTVNRYGFVSIQRHYIYAEQGLSRNRVSVWIYEGSLHLQYQQTMLAQYSCDYEPEQKSLNSLSDPILFQTPFKSPQLVLFELDHDQWLKIRQRPYFSRQKRVLRLAQQLPLPTINTAV